MLDNYMEYNYSFVEFLSINIHEQAMKKLIYIQYLIITAPEPNDTSSEFVLIQPSPRCGISEIFFKEKYFFAIVGHLKSCVWKGSVHSDRLKTYFILPFL